MLLLADTSAWHRSKDPRVIDKWVSALDADEVGICPAVRLEVLYSARSAKDFVHLQEELDSLHQIPIGEGTFSRAEEVQRALGEQGGKHHRSVKIPDLLVAAAAEAAGAIVWHYDEDFDRIAKITGQRVEWIARRGSL